MNKKGKVYDIIDLSLSSVALTTFTGILINGTIIYNATITLSIGLIIGWFYIRSLIKMLRLF